MTDALKSTIAELNKRFGAGAVIRLGDAQHMDIEAIPTGSLALDAALGVGGIPRGRITELYGLNSAGKTTVCQHIVAEAQRMGGNVAYVDMEHALDRGYAAACGVDVDALTFSQPDTGEQALEIAEALVRSGEFALVVVDSIAMLVPSAEIEGEAGSSHMGLQARMMSQAMRKIVPVVKQTNTAMIFTNQQRMKIGVVFGNPLTTSGGNAMSFAASVRMEIFHGKTIKAGEEVRGHRVKVRVTKNKVAPPFKEAEFDIMFGEGISRSGDLLDMGVATSIITQKGAFFSYGDTRIGQGRENAKTYLDQHPELFAEISALVRNSDAKNLPASEEAEEEM